MAAQLCPVGPDGEYVFEQHRIREFTTRANVFELRRYMITLRARNAFLCGLDAFAEEHVWSSRDDTMCNLIRTCCGLKVVAKNRRDHEWAEKGFQLDYRPMSKEDDAEIMKAARHWRGDCRDCGLSDAMSNNIASAELGVINREIMAVVNQFRATRTAYVGETEAKSRWIARVGVDEVSTAQKYEEVLDCMDAKLLETYNKMHKQLCTLKRLGIARLGMQYTSLDDFHPTAFFSWGQGGIGAAKRAASSASLAPRYQCLFGHIADQMRQDRLRFKALQGLRLNLDLPGSKRVKQLAQTYAETGAIGA